MSAVTIATTGRALVTGGAGFLGSHLVDRLVDDGWEVLVLDDLSSGKVSRLAGARRRGAVSIHQIDLRADELMGTVGRFSPDLVFHLAAQTSVSASVSDPRRDADINIVGAVNLLEASSRAEVNRFVFTSSVAVYGREVDLPARENSSPRPESPYGISKKVVEDYLRFWRKERGLEFTVIRPSNIYGPRQDPSGEAGVVAVFSRSCVDRRRPTIFGSGSDTRDYVFVDDVVDALLRAAELGEGGIYNIGTGVETSTEEVFERVARHARFGGGAIHGPPRRGDVPRSVLDWSLARDELGWRPFTTFEEGIGWTVDWFARSL
ncbi:MAG: NAD-dependent epimerase/dehydratase family protein [bacterium]|nr:NAD-dependent epimerase/dehydratase family protein [bacterium]MDE0288251.1 NAD-dependent epimerase/dehydratase family protein [bacterium]MDE0440315.1 NAD-dependent epimerase/dehydratase family protein [bacterium]